MTMDRWVGRCLLAATLLAMVAAPGAAQSAMNAKGKGHLQFVLDWWREAIQSRHMELTPKYQAETYIQHNINIQTGREGFVKFFGSLGAPQPIQPTLANPPAIAFAKGDYVVIVWEREGRTRPIRRRPTSTTPTICSAWRTARCRSTGTGRSSSRRFPTAARPTAWTTTR
jgi:predicted SnoaL-like aldol condensation-catalyzing enzyme